MALLATCLCLIGVCHDDRAAIVLAWDGQSRPLISYTDIEDACTLALKSGEDATRRENREEWLRRRGQARFYLGQWEDAFTDLSECYRSRPLDNSVMFEYARCSISLPKRRSEGLAIAQKMAIVKETAARGNYLLGLHDALEGDFESALSCCDKAVRLAPEWMAPRYRRAICAFRLEKYDQCIEDLECVRKWPQAMCDSVYEVRLFMACALSCERRYGEAYAILKEAFFHSVDSGDVRLATAINNELWILGVWQENYEECLYLAQWHIDHRPNDPIGYRQAALADATLGKLKEATALADKALALNVEDSESWGTIARIYYHQGCYENAIRCFQRALIQAKRTPPANIQDVARTAFLLATCPDERFRDGKAALHLLDLTTANEERPEDNAQFLALRAIALAEIGETDQAAALMGKAIKIPPQPNEPRKHFEALRKQFSDGTPYRHDPLSPKDHLFRVVPLGFIGTPCIRLNPFN